MAARNNYTKGGRVRDTVRSLLEHSNLPNFPISKWKAVLSDDYMDLRKVIGGVESSVGDTREFTVIGGLEIGYGKEPPSKAISSASDWAAAFELYRAAVVYAFPHRNEELLAYRDYLNNTFRVFGTQYHPAVIDFDQRCRILYSRTHARALSDIIQFATEYARLTVQVAETAASTTRPFANASREPVCHRYNYHSCNGCSYRHVCLMCERSGHRIDDCPKKPGPSQPSAQHGKGGRGGSD
ncbi:hypothetical protein M407DRAFT_65863 [Tulasnella calospora MUT 4182]|uniref:CCHC-type domain-containing protein n=1 Tax=Tulasnella calospora MUT 4182 TaxID=1051891 RepID=A0A0C3QUT4_9AGAM|nr:hypothetical protein M407DRAFT_65863 [Tulasnella calospora MUT 4182]